ncbi:hypothetical protein THAOC_01269 [Thalassiosira oceanica]|uniref:Uncharacterized protein n=1 Tax=Thalassiosira oceanica TaxID=159749 RepID=K0TDZ2_THAOC|nr:hypothetical protein THAOC_01269 [Thalassiosira oceanica]|eukprot:EJK76938.1 hypothetical protein THAOC_01269 [Thalassiosira oceanica]
MAIRLKRSDDEVDQPTVAGSMDQMSVPSTVGRGAGRPAASGDSLDEVHSAPSLPSVGDVSPLESPTGSGTSPGAPAPATRYVSVFTVKKDCGGRSLEEVDLRALAIAYLSRMLKKFPNTHLLPYDRRSGLPRIVNIRDIPDGIDELANYVGEARVDQRTGKGPLQPPRRERRAGEQDEVVGVGGREAVGSEGEGAGGRQEEEHGEADEAYERAEDTGHAGVVEHGGRGALGGDDREVPRDGRRGGLVNLSEGLFDFVCGVGSLFEGWRKNGCRR